MKEEQLSYQVFGGSLGIVMAIIYTMMLPYFPRGENTEYACLFFLGTFLFTVFFLVFSSEDMMLVTLFFIAGFLFERLLCNWRVALIETLSLSATATAYWYYQVVVRRLVREPDLHL